MPTCLNDGDIRNLFFFKHVIVRFIVPESILTDYGKHFQNHMMQELVPKLGCFHEHSSPYYSQSNGQVEVVNRTLKTMLQWMMGKNKSGWKIKLFATLWAYWISMKTTIDFTPFQLVYGVESVLPIQWKIFSLELAVALIPKTPIMEVCLAQLN